VVISASFEVFHQESVVLTGVMMTWGGPKRSGTVHAGPVWPCG